jgi:hypothetical protein
MGFGDGAGAWGQGGVARSGTVEGWDCFMGGDVTGVISQNAVSGPPAAQVRDGDVMSPW